MRDIKDIFSGAGEGDMEPEGYTPAPLLGMCQALVADSKALIIRPCKREAVRQVGEKVFCERHYWSKRRTKDA